MFAFFSLSTGPGPDIKQFAIGLAAGIIFDATVIRALLVPSTMMLLGPLELVAADVDGKRPADAPEPARARHEPRPNAFGRKWTTGLRSGSMWFKVGQRGIPVRPRTCF